MDAAISTLKSRAGATQVRLVGYSGGGVVAALVAARRLDVAELVTIAAPMDTSAFTAYHVVSSLVGSLSPVEVVAALSEIPQAHYVGGQDTVVPLSIVKSYMRALPKTSCARMIAIPSASHTSGWLAETMAMQAPLPPCMPDAA